MDMDMAAAAPAVTLALLGDERNSLWTVHDVIMSPAKLLR
jgi:hypothetical protein